MGYPLVKFGADSFTIQGDTECDRQLTDGQTQGDSNSSAGFRPVELKNPFRFAGFVSFLFRFVSVS